MNYMFGSAIAWLGTLALLASSAISSAASGGIGHGFPPSLAQLEQAAALTAAFNEGPRTADLYPTGLPYQLLYFPPSGEQNNTGGTDTTFYVAPGTRLYVPVFFNDNSNPVIGDFPPAGDRAALLYYMFSPQQIGVEYATITVDGQELTLTAPYFVQVEATSPLPTGASLYQAAAAILTPFSKGTHTVGISLRATGAALNVPPFDLIFGGLFEFSATYTVIVR